MATSTPGAKVELQRAAERHGNARREGDRRIPRIGVEHQPQRAGGVHRQVLFNDDRQRAGRRTRSRIAVIVADDQRRARRQVEARNVPVGLNQIARIRAVQRGEIKVRSSRVGPAEVRVGQYDFAEVRTSQVGLAEISVGQTGRVRFAFVRLAPLRFALVSVAMVKSALVRFWPARFTPARLL